MREVTLRAAAADLDRVVAEALSGEDVVITRNGRREAVVVSWASWERRSHEVSFGSLLASAPLEDGDIPPRHPGPVRDAER